MQKGSTNRTSLKSLLASLAGFVVLVAVLAGCSSSVASQESFRFTEPEKVDVIREHITLEEGTYSLSIPQFETGFGSVIHIEPSDTPAIDVNYARALKDADLDIHVEGRTITIYLPKSLKDENYFHCTIRVPVSSINLYGNADIYWNCAELDNISLTTRVPANGMSSKHDGGIPIITLNNISCYAFSAQLAGPAVYRFSGRATDLNLEASGASYIRAGGLESNRAHTVLSDNSALNIRTTERIVCDTQDEAELTVHGDAEIVASGNAPEIHRDGESGS